MTDKTPEAVASNAELGPLPEPDVPLVRGGCYTAALVRQIVEERVAAERALYEQVCEQYDVAAAEVSRLMSEVATLRSTLALKEKAATWDRESLVYEERERCFALMCADCLSANIDRMGNAFEASAADAPDVADIIAGALQCSRAYAYKLMEEAVKNRYA